MKSCDAITNALSRWPAAQHRRISRHNIIPPHSCYPRVTSTVALVSTRSRRFLYFPFAAHPSIPLVCNYSVSPYTLILPVPSLCALASHAITPFILPSLRPTYVLYPLRSYLRNCPPPTTQHHPYELCITSTIARPLIVPEKHLSYRKLSP